MKAPTSRSLFITLLIGQPVPLLDYRNRVLLVNFWASWCPPCVAESPSLQALRDTLVDEPFEILALNVGEDSRQVRGFLGDFQTALEFPILLHADHGLAGDWNVTGLPTTALVDKWGRFAAAMVGPRDWNRHDTLHPVRVLLQEK